MKVAVLIDQFNVGGVEKVAIEEVRALTAMGLNTCLLVLRRNGISKDAFMELRGSIPIIYLDDRLPAALRFSFRIPFFYFFSFFHISYPVLLPWVVRRGEFDFLVSHSTYTSLTALTLARVRGIPYAIFVWDPITYILTKAYTRGPLRHAQFLTVPLGKAIDRLLVRHARAVLVSGDLHYAHLVNISGPTPIHLIAPGHDPLETLPVMRGDYLLAATAWKEGKQLEDLLAALAKLDAGTLKVAGDWVQRPYRKRIERLIADLGLTSRVELVGKVSETELNLLYMNARAAVTAYQVRGFGLPSLEAAANGCPFITPEGSGVCRFFERDVDAFYFPDGDLNQLAQHLGRLLEDERLAYEMGRHAWQTVRARYTWQKHAQQLTRMIGIGPDPGVPAEPAEAGVRLPARDKPPLAP